MKIELKHLRWKNFLSYGNKWTEIDFPSGFRSIRGSNGAGKSSIVDALFYGLFGKTYRDVKMDELVNRNNGKNMLVEVTFFKNGDEWKITRGRCPNVLEITCNGKSVDLLSSKAMTQNELDGILGINQELFKRIVVLSIGLTKPFMTMSASEQREFLSDVFNLGVFSKMTTEVKKKISSLKVDFRVATETKRVLETSVERSKKNLETLKQANDDLRNNKETELADLNEKLATEINTSDAHKHKSEELSTALTALKDSIEESKSSDIDSIREEISNLKAIARQVLEHIDFFGKHDECPTCGQKIDSVFKENKLNELNAKKSEIGTNGNAKKAKLEELVTAENERKKKVDRVREIESDIRSENNAKRMHDGNADMIRTSISKLEGKSEIDISDAVADVKKTETEYTASIAHANELETSLNRQKKMVDILSDNGVRGYYIEKYIGVVNTMVNRHLKEFGIGLEFVFDSSLEAKLKTSREEVNYMSCSEGEKKRIDMAVLLSFMEITKVLSNWSCNVVFFDELFDSSVDDDNLNAIVGVVKKLVKDNEQCAYVITHRHLQDMNFDGLLEITKQSRFSSIEVV